MQQAQTALPRFLFEDCLGLLRALVVLAWAGVLAGVSAEIWVRCFSGFEWPRLGGFSSTYNAILLEFALNTVVLTVLLVRKDWYERVPRATPHRLRWLLFAVLAWEGLHLFGAFHVTGSLHGPLLPLVPLLLAGALIFLPGRAGGWLAGYLLAGHLAVVLLEHGGAIHSRGLLADAFSLEVQAAAAGPLVLLCVVFASIVAGVVARHRMYPGPSPLAPAQRLDHSTGLFRRAFLDYRIGAELGRTRRQGGHLGLVLIAPEGMDAGTPSEEELRSLSGRLLPMLRLESDTPARFAPGVLAILLPAADAEGLATIIQRVFAAVGDVRLRAAAVATNAKGVDGAGLARAAEDALRNASAGTEVRVLKIGTGP